MSECNFFPYNKWNFLNQFFCLLLVELTLQYVRKCHDMRRFWSDSRYDMLSCIIRCLPSVTCNIFRYFLCIGDKDSWKCFAGKPKSLTVLRSIRHLIRHKQPWVASASQMLQRQIHTFMTVNKNVCIPLLFLKNISTGLGTVLLHHSFDQASIMLGQQTDLNTFHWLFDALGCWMGASGFIHLFKLYRARCT